MDVKYVYAIQHNVTKKIYISSTKNVKSRYLSHMCALRKGKHASKDMQADFVSFGENYSIYILEEVENPGVHENDGKHSSLSRITTAEYKWMEKYKTITNGYNNNDKLARKHILKECVSIIPLKDGLPELPQ